MPFKLPTREHLNNIEKSHNTHEWCSGLARTVRAQYSEGTLVDIEYRDSYEY